MDLLRQVLNPDKLDEQGVQFGVESPFETLQTLFEVLGKLHQKHFLQTRRHACWVQCQSVGFPGLTNTRGQEKDHLRRAKEPNAQYRPPLLVRPLMRRARIQDQDTNTFLNLGGLVKAEIRQQRLGKMKQVVQLGMHHASCSGSDTKPA